MKIYTDEFLEARDKFEEDATEALLQWAGYIGSDSMIDLRIISIGDSNEFDEGFFVNSTRYKLDIKDLVYNRRLSTKEISENISKVVIKNIENEINKTIDSSKTEIKTLSDVRKRIKVVIDADFSITNDLDIVFGFGVEEYKK